MMTALEPPRWPSGPQICVETNLPALPTMKALDKFIAANGPSCKVVRKGKCKACGLFHAETKAPGF